MWDSVIIGSGNRGNSATRVSHQGNKKISQNNETFWISDVYLGLGMTIFKSEPEGICLQQMISKGEDIDVIEKFLIRLLVKRMDVDDLVLAIENEVQRSFHAGREDKAEEFRKVLGV